MKWFIYLKRDSYRKSGRLRVNLNSYSPQNRSLSKIIRKELPHPYNYSRLIIVETDLLLEEVVSAADDENLKAIQIEPRKY